MPPQNRHHNTTRRRGSTYLIALALLAMFASMAVAYASFTNLNVVKSDNQDRAVDARLAAESGLQYMIDTLRTVRLPGSTTAGNLSDRLAEQLDDRMSGTGNLGTQNVSVISGDVYVPEISFGDGAFCVYVSPLTDTRAVMEVIGSAGGVTRRVSMEYELVPRQPAVFDYGLASRGQVNISGSANIVGINYPQEANVLSATDSAVDAITVDGNVTISGGLATSSDTADIVITGSPSIAGSTNPDHYADDIRFGVDTPDFPELDLAPLEALAVNTVDSSTPLGSKDTFSNIRIAAGTNPTFSNKITINGVVFVEAPNVVRFEGGAVLNGLIVTDQSDLDIADCQIYFGGHTESYGVDSLPDTAEFAEVKQQTGTFLIAPSFGVTFAGTFSAINGSIAADQLTFTGTAEGVVKGSVIGLADYPTTIGGNVDIYVDRLNADPDPAGFVKSLALIPLPETYLELR